MSRGNLSRTSKLSASNIGDDTEIGLVFFFDKFTQALLLWCPSHFRG